MSRSTGLLVAAVSILCVVSLGGLQAASVHFRRGDSNADGRFDLSDPIATLSVLFLGGEPVSCRDAADSNDDGSIDISDALYTLLHLFAGGPPEPAPRADLRLAEGDVHPRERRLRDRERLL
ncbi:MAG: hypothetical protein ACUVYA_08290 [Planctomycetota bacterium]